MQELKKIVNLIENSEDYGENALVLNVLISAYKNEKKIMTDEHYEIIMPFIVSEAEKLAKAVPSAESYRQKDEMFAYEDRLLELYALSSVGREIAESDKKVLQNLINLVSGEQIVERSVERLFSNVKIDADKVKKALETLEKVTDEYQRGGFYNCLLQNTQKFSAFTESGRCELSDFIAKELEKYLGRESLTADEAGTLELIADVSKFFFNGEIGGLLQKVMLTENNGVRFFTAETLIANKCAVPAERILPVAQDLRYAYLLFCMLAENKRTDLFPKELATAEHLAKSDMVQWLAYPTELGKAPEEIVPIGCAKVKKELYYIFKFKSDSDTLSDDLKNIWLIGWSSSEGGTFSDFDRLCDYECKTPEKTVKNIVKKLLK